MHEAHCWGLPCVHILVRHSRLHALNRPSTHGNSAACIIRLNTIVSHFELGRSRVTEKFKISVNISGRLRCLVVLMVMKFSQHILIGEYGTKQKESSEPHEAA